MRRIPLATALIALTVLLLSACATPSPETTMRPDQRAIQLEAFNDYRVLAGLGIWTDEESITARIDWQDSADVLTLKISGPLGIGNMVLTSKPNLAVLTKGGQNISSGRSVDQVVQRGLGLTAPVPMEQLRQWVRGLPGNAKSVERDRQGKLSSIVFMDEQGVRWQARFLKYSDLDGLAVPALITASGGPYSVRLKLKDWQRSPEAVVPEKTQSNTRLAIPRR